MHKALVEDTVSVCKRDRDKLFHRLIVPCWEMYENSTSQKDEVTALLQEQEFSQADVERLVGGAGLSYHRCANVSRALLLHA